MPFRKGWKRLISGQDRPNRRLYETAVFAALRDKLRSGDVADAGRGDLLKTIIGRVEFSWEHISLSGDFLWDRAAATADGFRPTDGQLTVELEITAAGQDGRGEYALADGWLWVDGRRIYHVAGLGARVVPGDQPPTGATA